MNGIAGPRAGPRSLRRGVFDLLSAVLVAVVVLPHGLSGNVTLRFDLAGVAVHPLDLLFLAFVLAAMPLLLSEGPRLRAAPLKWPFLATLAVVATSTVLGLLEGHEPWDVLRDVRSAGFLLMAPLAYIAVRSPRDLTVLFDRLALGAVLVGALTLALALAPPTLPLKYDVLEYWKGSSRIYFHGQFVFPLVAPALAHRALAAPTARRRALEAAFLGLVLGASFLTLTRNLIGTTLLAAAGGTAFFLVDRAAPAKAGTLRQRVRAGLAAVISSRSALLTLGAVAAVAAGATVLLPSLQARLFPTSPEYLAGIQVEAVPSSGGGEGGDLHHDPAALMSGRLGTLRDPGRLDSSFRGRQVIYQGALEQAAERPWLGQGFGALFEVPWALEGRRPVRTPGHQPTVDSLPLTLLAKSGLVGLAVAAWFALALLRVQLRGRRLQDAALRAWSGALVAGTLALMLGSLLHTVLLTSRFTIVFAAAVGLSAALGRFGEAAPAAAPAVARRAESR